MQEILDLVRFPLDDLDGGAGQALVQRCRDDLERFGMVDLDRLVRPPAVRRALAEVAPLLDAEGPGGGVGTERQGVYPEPPPGLPAGHPALAEVESGGTILGGDRLGDCVLARIYHYPPLSEFLARVMGKLQLHSIEGDGLCIARYAAGEASGWHFDRAEFKVTLLLQAAQFGGIFEYARDLRSDAEPNTEGVVELLAGRLQPSARNLMPGTLNVFRGRNTAHRVTRVGGDTARIIAEFLYDDRPGAARAARVRAASA